MTFIQNRFPRHRISFDELKKNHGPLPPSKNLRSGEIWVEGENINLLSNLPTYGIGIVGTRKPQPRSVVFMEQVIAEWRSTRLIVVSGFARGIDSRAHELSIQNGLPTIAVLGCGLNITYPNSNLNLRKRILNKGGLIISELPPDTPPYPGNFLERNRWIPYFSQALWVVEAAAKSGSLNTAGHAESQTKQIYATPAFPDNPCYAGNSMLLQNPSTLPLVRADSINSTWIGLIRGPTKPQTIIFEDSPLGTALNRFKMRSTVWNINDLSAEMGTDVNEQDYELLKKLTQQKIIFSPYPGWFTFKT